MGEVTIITKFENTKGLPFHSFSALLKVAGIVLLFWCLCKMAPLLITLFIATLISVSLYPLVKWMESKKISKEVAVTLIALLLIGVAGSLVALIIPKLLEEVSSFIISFPNFKQGLIEQLSKSESFRKMMQLGYLKLENFPKPNGLESLLSAGNLFLGGLAELVLICVFVIYLLIDGEKAVKWFSAFFRPATQNKLRLTVKEISVIISCYVSGQVLTSLFSFMYVLVALSLLKLPNVLLLATLAGIFDILPILGFFLAVIPALLLAYSISPLTALYVLALYIFYHTIENYLIVPAVYGNKLRLSSFVVLVALVGAGLICGLQGTIAVLPVVASYPIIERLWLKKIVGEATVLEHKIPRS